MSCLDKELCRQHARSEAALVHVAIQHDLVDALRLRQRERLCQQEGGQRGAFLSVRLGCAERLCEPRLPAGPSAMRSSSAATRARFDLRGLGSGTLQDSSDTV